MRVIIFLILTITIYASTLKNEIELGVSFYKKKQYERALEIFDRLLIENPTSKRIRLEYARVLYAMGKYDEAKKEFLIVLNQNPPSIVKKNIKWFINKCEKKKKTNFFSGAISIGSISDSNIENKSDNPMYGGFVDSNPNKRKDNFTTIELLLNHAKKIKNSLWQNSIYIYDELVHEQNKDKITYYSLQSSYNFLYNGLRFTLPISLSQTDIASSKYVNSITFFPKIQKKLSSSSMISFGLKYQKNKNATDSEKDNKMYGINSRFFWNFYNLTSNIGIKYETYNKINGNRIDIAKKRYGIDIATSYSILPSSLLNLFFRNSKDIYDEKDPTIFEKRVDKLNNFSINLQQKINRHRFFNISFIKTKNNSNIDFYSYDKTIFSIKATQTF